jgi:hypothetical protein
MEDMLGAVVPQGAGFAAGTSRLQHIPETKDISDVTAVVDMVIYADRTADVQNERAFRKTNGSSEGPINGNGKGR